MDKIKESEEQAPAEEQTPAEKKTIPVVSRHFPTWLYHREQGGRIFHSAEEVAAAGKGWRSEPWVKGEQ